MKTAISLPDRFYKDAEKTANDMGIPRSQLFALALEEFIKHHKHQATTEKANEAYENIDTREATKISFAGLAAIRKLTANDTW